MAESERGTNSPLRDFLDGVLSFVGLAQEIDRSRQKKIPRESFEQRRSDSLQKLTDLRLPALITAVHAGQSRSEIDHRLENSIDICRAYKFEIGERRCNEVLFVRLAPLIKGLLTDVGIVESFACGETKSLPVVVESQSAPSNTEKLTWEGAKNRLEMLRSQGESYTSQPKLARQLKCSPATINKAINASPELKKWAKRQKKVPTAQALNDIVMETTPQTVEPDPADEVAIREFIENAEPDTRAWFQSLKPQDQLDYLNDRDNPSRSLRRV